MTSASHRSDLRPGRLLDGRYRVGRELGRGAMGVVYEARHERLDRRVAVKMLHAELASESESCERFEREARAAARIGSEHIVDIYDAGELAGGRRYLVMEYLRGETMKQHFQRLAPLPPPAIVPMMVQLLDGLAAAHDAGIVHRDVKPENLFLVSGRGSVPVVKIVDFGISKFRDSGTDSLRSCTGVVLGTPHYMSPEQARGLRDVDRRADVYSAGVVLYEGLSGRRPFSGANVPQLLFQIALEEVGPIEERVPGIDPQLSAIVACATANSPDRRYASARLFADDLRAWLEGRPTIAQKTKMARVRSEKATCPVRPPHDSPLLDEETRDAPLLSLPVALQAAVSAREPNAKARAVTRRGRTVLYLAAGLVVMATIALAMPLQGDKAEPLPVIEPQAPPTELPIPTTAVADPPPAALDPPPALPIREPAPAAHRARQPPRVAPEPAVQRPHAAPPPSASPAVQTPRPIRRDL